MQPCNIFRHRPFFSERGCVYVTALPFHHDHETNTTENAISFSGGYVIVNLTFDIHKTVAERAQSSLVLELNPLIFPFPSGCFAKVPKIGQVSPSAKKVIKSSET